jgi:hypothetical protein
VREEVVIGESVVSLYTLSSVPDVVNENASFPALMR